MTVSDVIKKFEQFPYAIDMGANKLSSWWDVPVDLIKTAKKSIRDKNKITKRR